MKTIKSFRYEDYGIFLDLEDAPASVAVNLRTGDLQLDEGDGDDRYTGAYLPAAAVRSLAVHDVSEKTCQIVLGFGKSDEHLLGTTDDLAGANQWVAKVLSVMKKELPPSAPPVAGELQLHTWH